MPDTQLDQDKQTEIDFWDNVDIKEALKRYEHSEGLKDSLDNNLDTQFPQSYSTRLYPDFPYVNGIHPSFYESFNNQNEDKKKNIVESAAISRLYKISQALELPPELIKPRKRINVSAELGYPSINHDKIFISDKEVSESSVADLEELSDHIKGKRKRFEDKNDNVENDNTSTKKAKLPNGTLETTSNEENQPKCDQKPCFSAEYAQLYNRELYEYTTGTNIDKQTDQLPGIVDSNKSTEVPDNEKPFDGSYVCGTWWSSEEKEKFFVFLGRRSRHNMSGIAEAIGTKSLLECEVYHNLLFNEAQKLRFAEREDIYTDSDDENFHLHSNTFNVNIFDSKLTDTDYQSMKNNINFQAIDDSVAMKDIPASMEMSQSWIDIEEVQAKYLNEWEKHLDSECPIHSPFTLQNRVSKLQDNAHSEHKRILINPYAHFKKDERLSDPQQDLSKEFQILYKAWEENPTEENKKAIELFQETEEFYQNYPDIESRFEHFKDDGVNSLVRTPQLMEMANIFRMRFPITPDSSFSKEEAQKDPLRYIDGNVVDTLNRIVIDHTRAIIRYVLNRQFAIGPFREKINMMKDMGFRSMIVTKEMMLSVLQEIGYILPKHSMVSSLFIKENVDIFSESTSRTYSARDKIFNPYETTKWDKELLNRRDYQSAYMLFREPVHQSDRKPWEKNDSEEEFADQTDGSDDENDDTKMTRINIETTDLDGDDRVYMKDELLNYSLLPKGHKTRKLAMIRAIKEPRSLSEFTQGDIQDMIATARMLDQKKVTHSYLLERTLTAQNYGRDWGHDDESNDEDDENLSLSDSDDFMPPVSDSQDEPETDNNSSKSEKIDLMDTLILFEELVLNKSDYNQSQQHEEELINTLSKNEKNINQVYKKLRFWYYQDEKLKLDCQSSQTDTNKYNSHFLDIINSDILFEIRLLVSQILFYNETEQDKFINQLKLRLSKLKRFGNADLTNLKKSIENYNLPFLTNLYKTYSRTYPKQSELGIRSESIQDDDEIIDI